MSLNLYDNLYKAVKKAYSTNTGIFCQNKTNELWSTLKKSSKTEVELFANLQQQIKNLQEKLFF